MKFFFSLDSRLRGAWPALLLLLLWAAAMVSLLGVHYFLNKPKVNKALIAEIKARIESLTPEQKIKLKYYEGGVIRTSERGLIFVDNKSLPDEIEKAGLSLRKIEFQVEDPLLLERQMMVREAMKKLNEAERRLVAHGYGVILVKEEGNYYLIFDSRIYKDYVDKYGTECKNCGDK